MNDRTMEDWTGEVGDRWLAHVDTFESMMVPAGDAAIASADFRPGHAVCDIGCGGGATSAEIARRVAPGGRVLGLDVAPQLVSRAQARAADGGPDNLSFQCADAQTATPEGAPFDRLFSRFGVMFFSDPPAAFANMRGWLKPDGQATFAVWAPPDRNPWMAQAGALVGEFAELPQRDPEGPGPFRMADPDATRALLTGAGYRDIEIAPWTGDQYVGGYGATPERAAAFVLTGFGMGAFIEDQAPDRMDEARAALTEMFAAHYRDGSVRMPAAIWLVKARA